MHQPIAFTPADIVWLAGAIVAIAGAVKVIANAIAKARKPNQTQDERIGILEHDIRKQQRHLDEIEHGNIITQRALLALLSHGIDGNDVDAMKRAKEELTTYLIER